MALYLLRSFEALFGSDLNFLCDPALRRLVCAKELALNGSLSMSEITEFGRQLNYFCGKTTAIFSPRQRPLK
jgi:hypothetical protein